MTSDASCVIITNSFANFEREVFDFRITGLIRRKKENVPLFKLILEMKFILTC